MSATMGYTVVADLSHELETLLDVVRRGDRQVNAALMDTLFAAADMLEQAIELSVAGRGEELDVTETIAALRAASPAAAPVETRKSASAARGRRKRAATSTPTAAGADSAGPPPITIVVTQEPNTPMPGVRAYLVIERAKALGT